jgi:hypothetical protein
MPEVRDRPEARRAAAVGREIRTPRAAAVAGLVFSVLLIVALLLLDAAIGSKPGRYHGWLTDETHRKAVLVALGLIPFAAIAFLWFIGVVRDYLGDREDRFFATVFLGSGLLFLAMMLAGAALGGGLVASAHQNSSLAASGVWDLSRRATNTLMHTYAMRMAAVFMISSATLLLRTGLVPRLLALAGYAIAAVLMIAVGTIDWVALLFPAWVALISLHILRRTRRKASHGAAT